MQSDTRSTAKERKREAIIREALEQFSKRGYYSTTIPDIASALDMSVGNLYNYFQSKEILAREILRYISRYLGNRIKEINESEETTKEKLFKIVDIYFKTASKEPEMIDYFLRVYLSNREVFQEECKGMTCVTEFVAEIMIFFENGVARGDLKNQEFFSAFGLFMGYLGGMAFLNGEEILPKELQEFSKDVSENIYNALKI
ncbi:MAG: TetR/AcrR family transcriptional regulator [Hydrogenimonas sp.]|nr:TetR/AcrR family transcriptional regulator [Hydrogenimonas sp.]